MVSTKDHAALINDYISFITVIIYKLFDRSLISFVIIRNVNALNSNKITCREDEILQEKMKAILKHFLNLEIFLPLTCGKVLEQHTQFLEEVKRVNSHELRYFKKLNVDIRRYNKCPSVVKIILTLSHGQAAVKGRFSLGKSILQVKIKEDSIFAKEIVRDHLLANNSNSNVSNRFAIF